MKCIIIDDELHGIKTLTSLLESNFRDVEILASCNDATKAYEIIVHYNPDVIFLDIEMPLLNGFDLLAKFQTLPFEVIFTTAYDFYALKAIKYSALDYLLKPIAKEDLSLAFEKLRTKRSHISAKQIHIANAVHNRQLPDTIALPTAEGLTFMPVGEIVYCSADGNYTRMYMIDNTETLLSKTLGDVDELLSDYHFFRIHHSTLINLKQVKKYIRGEGGEVIMSNGQSLQVARTRKADFLNIFMRF
ncbi:MAG: LytTR family DNA-binding domain-containing protein [Deltaproteobacteria bacterium]